MEATGTYSNLASLREKHVDLRKRIHESPPRPPLLGNRGPTPRSKRFLTDRDALLSAVAAIGYRELATELAAAHPEPTNAEDLADIAVAYSGSL